MFRVSRFSVLELDVRWSRSGEFEFIHIPRVGLETKTMAKCSVLLKCPLVLKFHVNGDSGRTTED